jgi:hypothetical protein
LLRILTLLRFIGVVELVVKIKTLLYVFEGLLGYSSLLVITRTVKIERVDRLIIRDKIYNAFKDNQAYYSSRYYVYSG